MLVFTSIESLGTPNNFYTLGGNIMEYIKTEKRGEIFIVQINRPERLNALGYQIRTELAEAWSEFRESSDLEVGIFTGTGRAFCAGEDM